MKLHNSQSRKTEEFAPRDPGNVTMYVCGPTVYGPAHLGNARPAVVFDQLFRVLRHQYGEDSVKYARNITDIDDKIINASIEQGVSIEDITSASIERYHADLESLSCLPPTYEPRATENIAGMRTLIKRLLAYGHAYTVKGEVFFSVPSNPYPGLANHTETEAGARVEVDPKKRDPRDFVLWKPAKEGEPWWNADWGKGRPGWHIECSAMIAAQFQEQTIDIHGGGADLRFPHHEAECAQSQCAMDGRRLANYWLHNGLLTVDGEKMSKSLGNVIMMEDLLKRFPGESIRFHILKTHYRKPLNFTGRGMKMSHRALEGLYQTLQEYEHIEADMTAEIPEFFLKKLLQDLNTPAAIANLHLIAGMLEDKEDKAHWKGALIKAGKLLGLFNHTVDEWFHGDIDESTVEALIEERKMARDQKDWARADAIRQQLAEMGVTLADGLEGTRWRKT